MEPVVIYRIDAWLLFKVFMPVAHYIDKRWHINHYRIAAQIMMFSAFLTVIDNGLSIITPPHRYVMDFLLTLCAILICMIRYKEVKELEKLSRDVERDPSKIPAAAIKYIMPYTRLFQAIFGVVFTALSMITLILPDHPLYERIICFVGEQWFTVVAIGYYMAALPPSPHKRVEKKARDWSFGMMPKPVRT